MCEIRFGTNAEYLANDLLDEVKLFTKYYDGAYIFFKLEVSDFLRAEITIGDFFREYATGLPSGDALNIKRMIKRFAKLSLYSSMSERYGVLLPWGSLTGVRPTKLVYEMLREGGCKEDVSAYLQNVFFVSCRKADTVSEIIFAQEKYVRDIADKVNLYVHIPFCEGKCSYCSFPSADINKSGELISEYLELLCNEISAVKKLISYRKKDILSVYVGGGTPSVLSEKMLERLLGIIDSQGVEFTFEAGRPDSITEGKLRVMKSGGVTRICINPQTLNDNTLKLIGRNHTAAQFFSAFDDSVRAGFKVNADIIAGLEGEDLEDFKRTVDGIIELSPHNITVHTLSRKRGSLLADKELGCDNIMEMTEYAYDKLTPEYKPYYLYRQKNMIGNLENTGFSLPGYECVNNITVMEELVPVYACGAGSISKNITDGVIARHASIKDVNLYMERFDEKLARKLDFLSGKKV